MRILYILNGLGFSQGMPIGGADKRALEIGKRLEKREGVQVTVLTTQAGLKVLQQNGWLPRAIVTCQPCWWSSRWFNTLVGRTFSYLYLTFFRARVSSTDYDIVYPTSDFFFDLLPAIWIKFKARLLGRPLVLVGIVHHFIDLPWKRSGPWLANFGLYLSQRLAFVLLGLGADLVLLVDTLEGQRIARIARRYGVSQQKINYCRNGVDYQRIERVPVPKKEFQACFLGGLRPSKGIFDLVPIWEKVVDAVPEARLLVIGGGAKDYVEDLKSKIQSSNMRDKIILAGVVPQGEKFLRLKSAQVFISPSHEEGWGIVLCEAFACGLPVVCYDLPAFRIFKDGLVRVALHDVGSLAVEVVRLLKDSFVRTELAKGAHQEARRFGWDEAASREYEQLCKIIF